MARNGASASVEAQAQEVRREISLLQQQIDNTRASLAAAERGRREASARNDDTMVSARATECRRLQDSLDLLTERVRPLEAMATELYRQIENAALVRANHELERARARAESELRDVGERLRQARIVVEDLEGKFSQLQTRLAIMRHGDTPGIAPVDAETATRRAAGYNLAVAGPADDREVIQLRDGTTGRLCGRIGINHDLVIELAGGERRTIPEAEVVRETAAAV